jgi:hypothetical protein
MAVMILIKFSYFVEPIFQNKNFISDIFRKMVHALRAKARNITYLETGLTG